MNNYIIMKQYTFFLLLQLCLPMSILAQMTDVINTNDTSNYFYVARSSDITMKIVVSGDIKTPGLYEVKKGLRLDEVLALAGGPNLNARQYQDERTISIRVSRKTDSGRIIVYDETLDNYIVSIEEFPQMEDNDIILVDSVIKSGFGKRDVFTLASIGLSIVGIVLSLVKN